MTTKSAYAKSIHQLLIDEFETSNMTIKEWVSLVLVALSQMLKDYWMG